MRSPIAMQSRGSAFSSSRFDNASSAAHAVPPVGLALSTYRLPLPNACITSAERYPTTHIAGFSLTHANDPVVYRARGNPSTGQLHFGESPNLLPRPAASRTSCGRPASMRGNGVPSRNLAGRSPTSSPSMQGTVHRTRARG